MSLTKVNYIDNETIITAKNLNDIQDNIIELDNNVDNIQDNIIELDNNIKNIKFNPKAGFIYPLASATVPRGFLLCDGKAYSRTEYPELFAVIGTMYGSGNGSTTFNVPNLQTRVPVGAGNGYSLGDVGGEATHNHIYGLKVYEYYSMGAFTPTSRTTGTINIDDGSLGSWTGGSAMTADETLNSSVTNSTTTTTPHHYESRANTSTENNMQPYTVVNYIIATGKNTGVSVADIITGAQALPLGIEYGGTGATNFRDLAYNLLMSTLVSNECTRNTTNTTADDYNTFSLSVLGICILNISITISSNASSSYTEYVIATNCQKPVAGLWSTPGFVSGANNETKKCYIDPDGNLIIDSGADGIANKYLSGTLIYYVDI